MNYNEIASLENVYVSLRLCDSDEIIIREYCEQLGIEPVDGYHITLVNKKNIVANITKLAEEYNTIEPITISLQTLGFNKFSLPNKNIINGVYLFIDDDQKLKNIRNRVLRSLALYNQIMTPNGKNIRDFYKEFHPHMTITYDNSYKKIKVNNELQQTLTVMRKNEMIKFPLTSLTLDRLEIVPRDPMYGLRNI